MNTENYDQITLPGDLMRTSRASTPNILQVEVEFYETTPLNVTLPKTIALKVVDRAGYQDRRGDEYAEAGEMETGLYRRFRTSSTKGTLSLINTETRDTRRAPRGAPSASRRPSR